ncbi:Guanine nucleotide-binding protein-like 1 [Portunus trituberculatus]|uniref:Guanine nucleotide-binding protein-like 1 n=1 Tax=Portunus trituberculatus TaxID=210409 RepID=A0A5B7DWR8_PORTR|nr:Guanine nucleotide-binding protein-like 1 [Portunus trituberculatus]
MIDIGRLLANTRVLYPESTHHTEVTTGLPAGILAKVQEGDGAAGVDYLEEVECVNRQPDTRSNANRYNLKFRKETQEETRKRKAFHHMGITLASESDLEASTGQFYPSGLGYPARPEWNKGMSKSALDMSENRHFRLFCEKLDREFAGTDLSLYELNLETWRQLWRVTEMSDVLLVIVDARFPVAHFPPYLYHHLAENEGRGIILILNKCDLLPPELVVAWEHYFHKTFPKLLVVPFSSFEGRRHPRGQLRMAAESSLRLVEACQQLVGDFVDLTLWKRKIEEERDMEVEGGVETIEDTQLQEPLSTLPEVHQHYKDGVLTVGTIGHPNVGKSSLINALMGKKVVSVSKTPGHTKHFQTIFLTKNVKLCDCPGLVFPSTVTKPLQVILGSYPISQIRDPIGVVHYVAARLDIPSRLGLDYFREPSDSPGKREKWTAFEICEAWARKRGYFTRTKGGPDTFRAANELLRFCLNGQKSLVLYLRPPGYTSDKEKLKSDPRVEDIKLIQGSVCLENTAPEDEEKTEKVQEEEEEDDEESDDNEEKRKFPLPNVQNKFSLLVEDE